MADITMCEGAECPIKDSCRRFTAKVGLMQSYFLNSPTEDSECEYYLEIKK